jgi:hypothetical protein
MDRFFVQYSRAINITVNILLVVLCGISYALLLVLYITQGMWTESFMFVDRGSLPPTTAVPLVGVLLAGATSTLLTRSVEHSVWIRLLGGESDLLPTNIFKPDEIHQRSQWSVSPFARLLYVFEGRSWLLRISGLLLFGTAILNPILLYGVRPEIGLRARPPQSHKVILRSLVSFRVSTRKLGRTVSKPTRKTEQVG